MAFGHDLVVQGMRDRGAPILITTIVTAVAVLPFAVFGTKAGHEILGPMAVVILGGLFTATTYTLCVVPALYARFGLRALSESVDDDDLRVPSLPELQQV
jgi:Cu/Ag efflux pump CusA